MKKIAILGATGSIGTQTLDVVREHSDELQVVALAAGSNKERLKEQIKDKNVLILGYGREGHSTLHRVLEVGGFSSVTVADKNQVQLPAPAKALCGEHYMDTLDDYDLGFKSPGVVLSKDPEQ